MKKLLLAAIAVCTTIALNAQNNYYPSTNSVYLGVPTIGPSNGPNLQVHGIYDLCLTGTGSGGVDKGRGFCPKASRIQMTNLNTGLTENDGFMFTMSNSNFTMKNQESRDITIISGGAVQKFYGTYGRVSIGNISNIVEPKFAKSNVMSTNDNGLYIRTTTGGKYGISIHSRSETDNAIQVMGTDGDTRNFSVQAGGEVYARKYTTTLDNIPDYVFAPNYELMTLPELRKYIDKNSHLPNVPSAAEYAETGVDLGEMNRVLLEKVEELTLYILDLEERLNKIEANKE